MIKIINYNNDFIENIDDYNINNLKKYIIDFFHIYDEKKQTIKLMNNDEFEDYKIKLLNKMSIDILDAELEMICKNKINFDVELKECYKCIVDNCDSNSRYGKRLIYEKKDVNIKGVWLFIPKLGGWLVKQYCRVHRTPKMINLDDKVCKWCWDAKIKDIEKWNGYCYKCYSIIYEEKKYTKIKQLSVYDYLKEKNKNIDLIYDKTLTFVYDSSYRPDIQIILDSKVILIEIDENQHLDYSTENETIRINDLKTKCNNINKKMILLRFNPDKYKIGKKTIKSCWTLKNCNVELDKTKIDDWNNRLNLLNNKLNYYLINDVENNIIEYLFFSEN